MIGYSFPARFGQQVHPSFQKLNGIIQIAFAGADISKLAKGFDLDLERRMIGELLAFDAFRYPINDIDQQTGGFLELASKLKRLSQSYLGLLLLVDLRIRTVSIKESTCR